MSAVTYFYLFASHSSCSPIGSLPEFNASIYVLCYYLTTLRTTVDFENTTKALVVTGTATNDGVN